MVGGWSGGRIVFVWFVLGSGKELRWSGEVYKGLKGGLVGSGGFGLG